jgi:simple sugar transport system permease protein
MAGERASPAAVPPAPAGMEPVRAGGSWRWFPWAALRPVLGIVFLIVVNAAFDVFTPGGPGLVGPGAFLHVGWREGVPSGALIDVLNYGSTIVILALGMAPVIATRGVDLSVGSIMAICGAVAAEIVVDGRHAEWAIPAAVAVGAVCGLWNGILVSVLRLQPFVATLVLMVAGRGIAQLVTSSQITTFHDEALEYVGLGRPGWMPLPFPFLLAMVMLAGTVVAFRKTALGLLVEAVGGNPEASRLSGVRSRTLIAGAYVFSGVCAAVAGLIAAANIKGADPFNAGRNSELAAIFAVVVGGTSLAGGRFCLVGAAAGGMLMQCLTTTMYARNVSADVAPLPQALVILGACVIGAPRLREMIRSRRARVRAARAVSLSPLLYREELEPAAEGVMAAAALPVDEKGNMRAKPAAGPLIVDERGVAFPSDEREGAP